MTDTTIMTVTAVYSALSNEKRMRRSTIGTITRGVLTLASETFPRFAPLTLTVWLGCVKVKPVFDGVTVYDPFANPENE